VCLCRTGYQVDGKECTDKDECGQGGGNDCHASTAACSNTNGSFTCACNAGYAVVAGTVVGTNCSNVDECSGGGDGHSCTFTQATCVDTAGSFQCGCNAGFTLEGSEKGGMSCLDVDECAVQSSANASCSALGLTCLNTHGSFQCTGCPTGYEFNGTRCADIDECARGTHTCAAPPGGICNNTVGGFNCSCAPRYTPVQGQCVNTFVPQASPGVCPTSGDTTVTILMPSGVSGEVMVRFSEGGTGVAATLVNQGGKELTATCPSLSAPVSNGKGQVYTPAGEVLGTFDFAYTVPPPTLTPSRLPVDGGTVSLSVYATLPSNCTYMFGSATVSDLTPQVSSSLPSLVSMVVPPSATRAGSATVSISCLGGPQQAYLTYVALPTVSSAETQGLCETLTPCTLLATISDPPSSLATADDVSLSLSGLTEVAGGGAARFEVLSVGGSTAVLRITTARYLSPGMLRGAVAPKVAPSGFTMAQATASFNLTVTAVPVIVSSLSPLRGSSAGGEVVRMTVTGLPPSSPAPSVWFGGGAAGTVTVIVSDLSSTILDVTTPAVASAGAVFVSVGTLRNATARDSGGYFAYQSAGVSAACSVCEVGVQGGAGLTVTLTGFGGAASAITVSVVGGGSPSTLTSLSGGVAAITVPPWTAGGSVNGVISTFAAISEGSRTAYAQFYYRTPPAAVSLTFSSDGSKVYLVFDQKTNTPPCAPIFDLVADKLGTGWWCSWSESDKLTLTTVFGAGATLVVGDTLTIAADSVGDEMGVTSSSTGRRAAGDNLVVNASAAAFPIAPTVTVSAPKDIGVCDVVQIDVEGASPRPMTYVWSAPLDASLNSVLSAYTTGTISLAASSLPEADVMYEITVTAVTFLGGMSEPQSFTMAKRSLPPPLVTILFPAGPMYTTQSNELTASAEFSKCLIAQAPVIFTWSLTAAAPPASASNPEILNSSSSRFTIPPGVLTPGTTYYLGLFSLQSGSGSTSVDATVTLDQSPLKASIVGGSSRTVSKAGAVTLDASSSLDPDACPPPQEGEPQVACGDAALVYSWGCTHALTGDPCRLKANSAAVAIAGTAVTSLDISTVTLPPEGGLTVSCVVSKGSRSASAQVQLTLIDGEALDVAIDVLKQTPTRLSLRGAGSPEGYKWDMTGAGLVAAGGVASPAWSTEELVSTGWGSPTFGLQIMDAVEAGVLMAGATYTVSLSPVTASGAQGGCSFSFAVGLPPSGGTCSCLQDSGAALQTDFQVRCVTWSTDSLPLSYSFGVAPAGSKVNWMPKSFKSVGSFRLQAGSYNASTRIFDSDGMWATVQSGALLVSDPVLEPGGTVEGAVGGAAEYMDSLGQDSGMTMVAGSVADGLYEDTCSAEGTCGGRRRLLASSAAYRMRVRRLLLAKMGGGAGDRVSTSSVGSVLSAVSSLSSAPEEVGTQGAQDSVSMLASSTKNIVSDLLRSGGWFSTVQLCDSSVGMSERMRTHSARDRILQQTALSIQTASNVLVRSMTPDEKPFNATYASVGIWIRRLSPGATDVSLDSFYNSSFTIKYPNGIGAGSRRQDTTDGIGLIAAYIAGTWAPRADSVARSHLLGVIVVRGGPVAPPLPESVTNNQPSSCPLWLPMCVTVTLQIPVPGKGITPEQVTSGKYSRCFWWESKGAVSTFGEIGEWRQNCTHVGTELRGGFAHATCTCPKSGFYHADIILPTPPRTQSVLGSTEVSRSVLSWAIGLPVGICFFLAVMLAGSAIYLQRYMVGRFSHLRPGYKDANGSLCWAGQHTVMGMETGWRKNAGLPSVQAGETLLIADVGTLGDDSEREAPQQPQGEGLSPTDAGVDFERLHSGGPRRSVDGTLWGAGAEESRMALRRKRWLEDRAQWESMVKSGTFGAVWGTPEAVTPATRPKTLFQRIFCGGGGDQSSRSSQQRQRRMSHSRQNSHSRHARRNSVLEGYRPGTPLGAVRAAPGDLLRERSGPAASLHQGTEHPKLRHETTGSALHLSAHGTQREYDRGRRRSSFLRFVSIKNTNFKSQHGVIIDAWQPPHSVPNEDGLWWSYPKLSHEDEGIFASHWVHWFGVDSNELDFVPEKQAPAIPIEREADLSTDEKEAMDAQAAPENPVSPRLGNPTEYKMSKRPNPAAYVISSVVSPNTKILDQSPRTAPAIVQDRSPPTAPTPIRDQSPPAAPAVPAIAQIGSDFAMESLNPHTEKTPQKTLWGGEVADTSGSSDAGSTTAGETPKPRLFYLPESKNTEPPATPGAPIAPLVPIPSVRGLPERQADSPAATNGKAVPLESVRDPSFAMSPADYVLQMTAAMASPRGQEGKETGTGMDVNGVPVVGGVLLPGRSAVAMRPPSIKLPPRWGTKKAGNAPTSPGSWMHKQQLSDGGADLPFNRVKIPTNQVAAREAATLSSTWRSGSSSARPPDSVSPFVEQGKVPRIRKREWGQPVDFGVARASPPEEK